MTSVDRSVIIGLLALLLALCPTTIYAQERPRLSQLPVPVDSTRLDQALPPHRSVDSILPLKSSPRISIKPDPLVEYHSDWRPSSTKALLFALIPGGGQLYNRKYWKLPIVLGAFTACTYAVTWNTFTYNDYVNAYRDLLSDDPMSRTSWQAYIPRGADPKDYVQSGELRDRLRRGSDMYRRNRDLSIILSVGVYVLSLLDAYVDAELYDFNISSDLSMRIVPDYRPASPFSSPGYGLTCSFTLK